MNTGYLCYLCYGSLAIRNILIVSVRGQTLYADCRRQTLTYKDGPQAEKVNVKFCMFEVVSCLHNIQLQVTRKYRFVKMVGLFNLVKVFFKAAVLKHSPSLNDYLSMFIGNLNFVSKVQF